jgi:hypothetical protein
MLEQKDNTSVFDNMRIGLWVLNFKAGEMTIFKKAPLGYIAFSLN